MKTLEDLKAMSQEQKEKLESKLFSVVRNNNLDSVSEFFKVYPVKETFYEKCFEYNESFLDPVELLACAGNSSSKNFAMLELLEKCGLRADYEYRGDNALLAYIDLEGKKRESVIEYFLNKGAKWEVYGRNGETKLHFWAEMNEAPNLEFALKYGANPNVKNIPPTLSDGWDLGGKNIGATPLMYAGNSTFAREAPMGASIQLLLKYGAEVNAVGYMEKSHKVERNGKRIREGRGEYSEPQSVLDYCNVVQNEELLKAAGARSWEQLIKEYNIDTTLTVPEQVRIYYERLEDKSYQKTPIEIDDEKPKTPKTLRDIHKDEEYFDRYIRAEEKFLKKYNESHNIYSENFCIATAMYSRGDDIESIKQVFVKSLNEWKNNFDISDYTTNTEKLAVMILCDMNTSWVLEQLNVSEREKEDTYYDDWLLHFLASKGAEKDFSKMAQSLKKYDMLKLFIETKESDYFKTYLKQWYSKSRSEAWWGDHKYPDERLVYSGYWNYEGAAVLKILGVDKEEFKGYKYFPYDLI